MLTDLINNEIEQEEYLRKHNVTITYQKLPKRIYGFIYQYKNTNNVFINKSIPNNNKIKTIIHELAHLELNHQLKYEMSVEFCIDNIEDEADNYIKSITSKTE